MKIIYHLGNKEIELKSTVIPPIGANVEFESDEIQPEWRFTVKDVKFKLFLDDPTNIHEEVHVYLALDVVGTMEYTLIKEIEYTSTSTH